MLPEDALITDVGMAPGDTHPMDTHLHAWRHFSWWDHASLSSCKEKCYLLAASAAFYLNVHFDPFSVGTWLHLRQAKSGCQAHHSLPSPCPFRVVGCGFTLGECWHGTMKAMIQSPLKSKGGLVLFFFLSCLWLLLPWITPICSNFQQVRADQRWAVARQPSPASTCRHALAMPSNRSGLKPMVSLISWPWSKLRSWL